MNRFLSILFAVLFAAVPTGAVEAAIRQESGTALPVSEAAEIAPESAGTSRRLLEVLRKGGPLMIPIGACSVVLLVFVFERSISLRRAKIIPKPFVKRMLEELRERAIDQDEAQDRCAQESAPIAVVFAAGIRKWGKPSVEVEQAVLDEGERVSNELRKYLRLINGIATVSPLLGLLGTVLGMIHAFDGISALDPTMADPRPLIAAGISEALLTTAAGMTVAIPSIVAWLYFSGRVDTRVMEIDSLGQQLVSEISAEALEQGRGSARTRKTSRKPAA